MIGPMAKVTGKFQITLPKAVVDQCGIRVGDELELRPVGRSIQLDRRTTPDAPPPMILFGCLTRHSSSLSPLRQSR